MSENEKEPLDVAALYPQLGDIVDAKLREAVVEVMQELWRLAPWNKIADVPTSAEIKYPNLPHTQCIVELVIAVADAFEKHHGTKINRDYLIASAILQDASKVVEYQPDPNGGATHTEIGRNYVHGFWCAHLATMKGIPHEICHIILTHGSQSPRFPSTIEGKILYYVDQLDVIAIHGDRWKKTITISK